MSKMNFIEIAAAIPFNTLRALVLFRFMTDHVLFLSAKSKFSQDFPDFFVNHLSV